MIGWAKKRAVAALRLAHIHRPPVGAAPGTIVTSPEARPPTLHVFRYSPDRYEEFRPDSADDLGPIIDQRGPDDRLWIDCTGLRDADTVTKVGAFAAAHELVLADAVHTIQRAKVEEYPGLVFFVLRMPHSGDALWTEQVSLLLTERLVITFQESPGDCFEPVRDRLRRPESGLRRRDPSYLAYAIIDSVVDAYFPVLEATAERLEELESSIMERPTSADAAHVRGLRRDLIMVRRAVWPLRDAMNSVLRDRPPLFSAESLTYLRDCSDHAVQIIDLVESYRDIAADLIELHMAKVAQQTNDAMRFLAVIATIFIPLTLIAGVYGMNFDTAASPWNMPELSWKYGYPAVLALMALVTIVLLSFFYRRGWLRGSNDDAPPRETADRSPGGRAS